MKKLILATAALAVVIASPAFAARNAAAPTWGAYAQSQGAFASRDAGLGGDYVGTDPDANVRLELLKDAQQRSH
jgi:hypothetical protein